jgi:tetratricopeptide (TPR) repeat protein
LQARKCLERAAGPGSHIRGSYKHPNSVCKLAHILLWEGKVKSAGEKYLAALEIEPECAEATCGLGVVEWAQGRFLEAEELFALALESDLGLAPAVHWMVQSLLDQERDKEAFEVYADAVK